MARQPLVGLFVDPVEDEVNQVETREQSRGKVDVLRH